MTKFLLPFVLAIVLLSCENKKQSEATETEKTDPYPELLRSIRQNKFQETNAILDRYDFKTWQEMGIWDSAGKSIYHYIIDFNSLTGFHGLLHYKGVPGMHEPFPKFGPAPVYAIKEAKLSHVADIANEKIFYPLSLGKRTGQVWQDFYSDVAEIVEYNGNKLFWIEIDEKKHLIGYSTNKAANETVISFEEKETEILSFEDKLRHLPGNELVVLVRKNANEESFEYRIYSDPMLEKPEAGRLIFQDLVNMNPDNGLLSKSYLFHNNDLFVSDENGSLDFFQYYDGAFQKSNDVADFISSKTIANVKLRSNPIDKSDDNIINEIPKGHSVIILEKGNLEKVKSEKGKEIYTRWVNVIAKGKNGWLPNSFLEENNFSISKDSLYFDIYPGYFEMDGYAFAGKEFVMSKPENYKGESVISLPKSGGNYGSVYQVFLSPSKEFLIMQGCDEVFGRLYIYNIASGEEQSKSELCDKIAFSGNKLTFWEITDERREGEEYPEMKLQEVIFENGQFSLSGRLRWEMMP